MVERAGGDTHVKRRRRLLTLRAVQFSIEEQLLRRNVKRFRGWLVFKAHRRLYHSILGSRVIKEKESSTPIVCGLPNPRSSDGCAFAVWGFGSGNVRFGAVGVWVLGDGVEGLGIDSVRILY